MTPRPAGGPKGGTMSDRLHWAWPWLWLGVGTVTVFTVLAIVLA